MSTPQSSSGAFVVRQRRASGAYYSDAMIADEHPTGDGDPSEHSRADDTLDKISEIELRIAGIENSTESRFDTILRGIALIALAWLIALAYFHL